MTGTDGRRRDWAASRRENPLAYRQDSARALRRAYALPRGRRRPAVASACSEEQPACPHAPLSEAAAPPRAKHTARGSPIDRPMAGQGFLQDDRPDFPKILEFFTDPRTEDLQARQHALLKRIVQKCQHGFRLRELPVVAELLDIVPKRIEGLVEKDAEESEELERTLCNIIRIAKPNLRQKANEELLAPGLKAAAQILEKLLLL